MGEVAAASGASGGEDGGDSAGTKPALRQHVEETLSHACSVHQLIPIVICLVALPDSHINC